MNSVILCGRIARGVDLQKTQSGLSIIKNAIACDRGGRDRGTDFEKVIDAKYREWHGSPKMSKYLRPETLFGTKFDSYLNESGEGSAAIRIDTPEWYKRVKEEGYQEQKASAELIEQFEKMKRSMGSDND